MSCSGNTCSTASKGSCSSTSCSKGTCSSTSCCGNSITFTPENVTFHGYGAPSSGRKHIAVIGCGSSGLIVMKQLLELGHKVTCFESSPRIGGVYSKSYNNMMLTTSSLLTAFSDYSDGKEDRPVFWNDDQYLEYLDAFASKFNLYDHVEFSTSVLKAYKCPESGKWRLTVDRHGYTCPHRTIFQLPARIDENTRKESIEVLGPAVLEDFFAKAEKDGYENVKLDYVYDYFDHKTGERKTMRPSTGNESYDEYAFDGIAICSGVHTWASLPCFKGEERFKGPIIHSENYKTPEIFRGKRVLIIGAGESGSDIANEVANEASKVAIAVRGKHGHIIPRKQAHGRVTDLNTNRCRYSNPYILGDWVGWANQHAKKFVAKWGKTSDPTESEILQKIGELNLYQRTSAFSKFGCKNEGFVTAMVTKGAELHRDCFELFEDRAVFDDGSEFQCDAIVACTGYRNSFPFFEVPEICGIVADKNTGLTHQCISDKAKNPRLLYKQIFIPEFPSGEVAFFGFVRPAFGSVPPTVEMQARYYSLILNGQLNLPDTACMRAEALRDQCNWESRFGYDAKRVKGLVDFQLYVDDLAAKMGCLPPLRKIFFTNPKMWWKIMFGPFTMHQFRLVGPFANQERAQLVYNKQPVGDFLECSITAAFLITAKILSILGFKQFTPNNF